jgi:hypothetical protein
MVRQAHHDNVILNTIMTLSKDGKAKNWLPFLPIQIYEIICFCVIILVNGMSKGSTGT